MINILLQHDPLLFIFNLGSPWISFRPGAYLAGSVNPPPNLKKSKKNYILIVAWNTVRDREFQSSSILWIKSRIHPYILGNNATTAMLKWCQLTDKLNYNYVLQEKKNVLVDNFTTEYMYSKLHVHIIRKLHGAATIR